jgi:hypothetical protein
MNKYEEVKGIIIGGEYQHVKLIAPNGSKVKQEYIDLNKNPTEWAENQINDIRNQPLGNGISLYNYPDIFKQIYGEGEFTVLTNY